MGTFGVSTLRYFESMVHLTSTPVTLRLSNGPFRYNTIGTHTLFDFLNPTNTNSNANNSTNTNSITDNTNNNINNNNNTITPNKISNPKEERKQLVFERSSSNSFILSYLIIPISTVFRFALNEVVCLHRSTSRFYSSSDRLFAQVEFNYSPHALNPGPKNFYNLGKYHFSDVGPIHVTHNCM